MRTLLHCARLHIFFMKRALPLLTLLIIVIGGMFAYDQYVIRTLTATLTKDTTDIATAYGTLIDTNVLPLKAVGTFTQKQNAAVSHMTSTRADEAHEQTIAVRVSLIHDLQVSLIAFLQDLQPEQTFINSPQVATLQREMGKNGHMRDLLTTYNDDAKIWNDHQGNFFGSLSTMMPGSMVPLLPYLRFDGEQEYLTTIHL
jgi:hypothetical protein